MDFLATFGFEKSNRLQKDFVGLFEISKRTLLSSISRRGPPNLLGKIINGGMLSQIIFSISETRVVNSVLEVQKNSGGIKRAFTIPKRVRPKREKTSIPREMDQKWVRNGTRCRPNGLFSDRFALLWSLKSSPNGLFSDWFALLWPLKSSPNRLFSGLMLGLMLTSLCSKSRCKVDSKLFLISDIYSSENGKDHLIAKAPVILSRYQKSKII